MNESSAYLWSNIVDRPSFTTDDLTSLLTQTYEVDEATAHKDALQLAKKWIEAGIVEA